MGSYGLVLNHKIIRDEEGFHGSQLQTYVTCKSRVTVLRTKQNRTSIGIEMCVLFPPIFWGNEDSGTCANISLLGLETVILMFTEKRVPNWKCSGSAVPALNDFRNLNVLNWFTSSGHGDPITKLIIL